MSTSKPNPGGRPARFSKTLIVDTALQLLRKTPLAELSMQRIAKELKTGPSSIYAYFASQDELFSSISNAVVAGIELDAAMAATDWREAIRLSAKAIRIRLITYPNAAQILMRISTHTPAEWFDVMGLFVRHFRQLGLTEHALMDTVRCVSRLITGCVISEMTMDPDLINSEQSDTRAALPLLSDATRQEVEQILPYLGNQDNAALFDFTVERILDMLEALQRQASSQVAPVRGGSQKAAAKPAAAKKRVRKNPGP